MAEESDRNMGERRRNFWQVRVPILILVILLVGILLSGFLFTLDVGPPTEDECSWYSRMIDTEDIGPSSVRICFGKLAGEPEPIDLEIMLVRNWTTEGVYGFQGNDDGPLILISGVDVGTAVYNDIQDNGHVNIGDRLEITDLYPNSDYAITLIWAPTGDHVISRTFSTPAG